jgi:hypothetical protein
MGILLKNLIRRRVRRGRLDGSRLSRHGLNIPELQKKLQRRIDMVTETAKKLAEVGARAQ